MLYTKYIICAVNSCGFVVVFCFIVFIKALKAALSLAPNGGTGVAKKLNSYSGAGSEVFSTGDVIHFEVSHSGGFVYMRTEKGH